MTAKSKAELMNESRRRKIDAGLVRKEYWATLDTHKILAAKVLAAKVELYLTYNKE